MLMHLDYQAMSAHCPRLALSTRRLANRNTTSVIQYLASEASVPNFGKYNIFTYPKLSRLSETSYVAGLPAL